MSCAADPVAQFAFPPSPLELLQSAEFAAYVKRDDLLDPAVGCSKLRLIPALERSIAIGGCDSLLCLGPAGSSLIAAAAWACKLWGIPCYALVQSQVDTPGARAAIANGLAQGCRYTPLPPGGSLRAATEHPQHMLAGLRARGLSPRVVPFGGAEASLAVGYVQAGRELMGDLEALPRGRSAPATVYVTSATGRLACGIAIGIATAVPDRCRHLTVVPVGVSPAAPCTSAAFAEIVGEMLAACSDVGESRLPEIDEILAMLHPADGLFGRDYGEPVAEGSAGSAIFERASGFALDDTYAARAFAVLLAREQSSGAPPVFWLSGRPRTPASLFDETEFTRLLRPR
jgi:D-cysteine desulfhydrase